MAGLASELIAMQPDLVLTPVDPLVRLISERSKTVPIVFVIARDPVGLGLAASLGRPGGNVTGLTALMPGLSAKRLQLIKEAFPQVRHVALLFEPADLTSASQVKEVEEAAKILAIRASAIELRQAGDLEVAFERGAALGVHAYLIAPGVITTNHAK